MSAGIRLKVNKDADSTTEFTLANFLHAKLENPAGVNFGLLQEDDVQPKKKVKRHLVAETTRMQYVGSNYKNHSTYNKYMIAIVDKETRTAKLVDASMFSLEPHWPEKEGQNEEEQATLTRSEKVDMLTNAFGSHKRKRAMESRKKNKIESSALESAVGAAASTALQNIDPALLLQQQTALAQQTTSVLPPHNLDAQTPAEAYPLHSLLSPADLTALETPAQAFIGASHEKIAEWKKSQTYPGYILVTLQTLPLNAQSRSHMSCLLMYLHYLMHIHSLTPKQLQAKTGVLPADVPQLLYKKLLSSFTDETVRANGKRTRCISARTKDKLISYILVLALTIEGFHLEYSQLQDDLKIMDEKMVKYLRVLGCNVKKTKHTMGSDIPDCMIKMSELSVPLTFPQLGRKNPKAKR